MAYVLPTADDFLARFPKFDTGTLETEYLIESLIAEAPVDDSWIEDDYRTAIMYWVAHMMTSESGDIVDRAGAIVSESFGPMSRSYAQNTGTKDSTAQLGSTEYGRRFMELRKNNFPGIAVTC